MLTSALYRGVGRSLRTWSIVSWLQLRIFRLRRAVRPGSSLGTEVRQNSKGFFVRDDQPH